METTEKKMINSLSEEKNNFDNEKPKTLKKEINFCSKKNWLVFLAIVFISSFFGAVFGFLAGGVVKVVDNEGFFQKFFDLKLNADKKAIDTQKIIVEDSAIIDVVDKSSPAVVSIAITKEVSNLKNFDFFGFGFFQENENMPEKKQVGEGSGFFVSADGMIVTNRHVVEELNAEYTVIMNDNREFPAKVLARDSIHDIAIIKIEGADFPVLSLGDSDTLKIGQTVIAIGNSLGEFSNSVSRGIISGLGRTVIAGTDFSYQTERLTDIVQTDAAINSGNSGGPLIDVRGNVVGMNVAMARGAQNVGFALPINQVKRVVDQVKATGKISTPFLGVRYVPISKEMQVKNGLSFDYGVLIQRGEDFSELAVIPGSPADKAGLVENDVILEINGNKINQENQLGDLISKLNVGDKMILKVWSKGVEKNVEVILEERK